MSSAPSASSHHPLELQVQRLTEELVAADRELAAQQETVDQLVARQEQARESARRLLHALPTPVMTTDAEGEIELSNAAASALLAVPSGSLASTSVQAFIAAEDRPLAQSLLSRAGRDGTAVARLRVQPREGARREVQAVVSACSSEAGERRLVLVLPAGSDVRHDDGTELPELPAQLQGHSQGQTQGQQDSDDDDHAVAAIRSMAQLVLLAVGEVPQHQLLGAVAAAAVAAVPGATCSSASTGDPAQPTDSAADSAEAQWVDGAQWSADEGPASLAHRTGEVVVSADLGADERWPRLARRVAEGPVSAVVSVPLRVGGRVIGVVNAYGGQVGEIDRERASAFAESASAVLEVAERTAAVRAEVENLKLAMQSRAAIEQAKGALASRLECTVDEAFSAMVVMSQDRNVKVRDIGVLVASAPSDTSLDLALGAALERARQRAAGQPRA
ncbi:PAS fold-containing protein [Quadrisphaera granulorum]|uniref:PAS domain-containing protein n=1 Tax=Quadrisphaera granulorum TaxID=317664 RepID=A0A315ZS94_9ACTN|nr:PAS domain-containing protein [Quadrisphaera granulorum]SZE98531.1 PAS fold-containing protein [Quadrisphaera granulorum]